MVAPSPLRRAAAALARHRSKLVSLVGGGAVVAVVATVAVVSNGYTAQRMDLDDGSVWVANGSKQVIGRANTQVLQLDTVVASTTSTVEVHQRGQDVYLYDRGNSTLDVVDPATSSVQESVPVPPDDTVLHTTGTEVADGRAVLHSTATGRIWIVPLPALGSFDSSIPPDLSLGAGSVSSMESDGTLFVHSPEAGEVYRVDAGRSDVVARTSAVDAGTTDDEFSITSVGGRWAVLDATTRTLTLDGATVDLTDLIAAGASPVLQQAVTAEAAGRDGGDRLYVAHAGGLVRVPLGGGEPEEVAGLTAEGRSGTPAAPVVRAGCAYAAWSSGDVWRDCAAGSGGTGIDGEDPELESIDGMPSSAQLAFRTSGSRVVLNDSLGGGTWAVQDGNAAIDNWDELLARNEDSDAAPENDEDTPPEYETLQAPPIAQDDDLGARPGRATVLPVLLNDYDPNGDVLVIDELTTLAADVGSLELVSGGQQVLLTLPDTATGAVSFGYTISDGRGGTASATVTVDVRSPDENSPPQQLRTTKATVAAGGRVAVDTLGDWVDPDGDAFYLTSASVGAPDTSTWKPGGEIVFIDSGQGGDRKDVALAVSDGRADGAGTLAVTVRPAGEVPIVAEPFAVRAYVGEELTVAPLAHVRGGSGMLRLTNVPPKSGVTVQADYEGGTFRLVAEEAGTRYLDYTVSDGAGTATGTVRVDVETPPDANSTPITVPHTAFVRQGGSQNLDVLATDIDPAGGVLLVTGVGEVPVDSGVRVEILEQRLLRITLTAPLDGPVDFTYTVSNGLADAQGTVAVVEIPEPARSQPPLARADQVSVRVGDAIDIPVLANDEHPDGEQLTLDPELVTPLPGGSGLLFPAQSRLRYLAPDTTGNFTAVYRVNGPDGQWATAEVSISVREADPASNNPPVPRTVEARVLAGESVRIPVPLTGIDPDGDSVQLLGQESNPEKGAVTEVGSDWIEFEAGDYSAGTDTFTYRVVDGLGAQATGTVRVGISPRLEGARNPVAVEDEVTVRPGRTIAVQVLANDSDPDGETLSITDVEATTGGGTARVDGSVLRVVAPERAGRYGFVYSIENERGGTSSNFLTVIVDPDAPLARPIAEDTVLGLSDILGRESVDVNVLSGVFFAEGDPQDLDVSVLPGYGGTARVVDDKRIRVELGASSQIIPFSVRHPDDPAVSAIAFIRVPGFDDALPQLRKGAPRLTVRSGEAITIELRDYVVAVGDGAVRLTDSSTVRATHSDGADAVVDANTLRFRSAEGYFGPASIAFQVTDGESADDPDGRIATLVLPISVTPRENQPPVFDGGVLEFEPGAERTVQLPRLTTYPYADDLAGLDYSVLGSVPSGYSVSLDGQALTIRAAESVRTGAASSLRIGVRDGTTDGESGRLELRVVASTRPLASPAADTAVAPRGRTTSVDVLANDQAANPFPATPLQVVAVRGLDSASLPAGVRITPSADKSRLSIDVANDALPEDVTLQYQVLDATGDEDRAAWGTVTVSVQDKPQPVTNVRATAFGDRAVTIAFDPGAFNNAEITGFRVATTSAAGDPIATTDCASTTCTVRTPGNGPANSVRIAVIAVNAIGESAPTSLGEPVWSDIVPAAPASLETRALDHGLRVFWRKPNETGGSPINYYVVSVAGRTDTLSVPADDPVGTEYSLDVTSGSIANGAPVAVSVSARNEAYGRLTNWNSVSGSGTPAGAPVVTGTPSAGVGDAGSGGRGTVTLDWAGVFDGNGSGVGQYYAAMYQGTPPGCSASDDGGRGTDLSVPPATNEFRHMGSATSTVFEVPANTSYSFMVFAYNGQGCTASGEVRAVTRKAPGTPTSVGVGGPADSGDGRYDYRLDSVAYASGGGSPEVSYVYRLAGGSATWTTRLGGTLVADGSLYGQAVQIQVQVCEAYPEKTLCSDWSAPSQTFTPADTRPTGLRYAPGNGVGAWSWTGAPSGSGYSAVQYSCDGGNVWSPSMPQSGSCAAGADSTFQVRVITGSGTYSSPVYRSADFD
ncbi:Ig-like domain-containing protein [Naasia sp. SYSU D00057]|uniref:Ig-like domain-containing protein n=1 Tax=Naasia sp. SYSU D00057 TaxID=2817380 RepID=UPI0027DD17AE|nr:Ig-like domain-containing protein [Naasia sp. SYSU D00057]